MITIVLLFLCLSIYGVKRKQEGNALEISQTLALRGISSVEIMMGHIGLATGSIVLFPNRKAGILFVGIFFMLSGYGVSYSLEHKEKYMNHFIVRRCLKLFIPAYIVYMVYRVSMILICGTNDWSSLFSLKGFAKSTNWYVWEQLLFYVIFWLIFRLKPCYTNVIIGLLTVFFIAVAFVSGISNPWYGSSLCFVVGLYYYQYENKIEKVISDYFRVLIIGLSIVLAGSFFAFFGLGNNSIIGNPIARNIASISFCVIVIVLLNKYSIGNRVSVFLGKCSYEIFLVHSHVIAIMKQFDFNSVFVYCVVCIGVSLVVAAGIHFIIVECQKKLKLCMRG